MVTTTINYVYDSLYRLTEANYSDGRYFRYTYDSVGNRLTEEKCVTVPCTAPITNTYVYDSANRLTSVNGQPYTWDDNGNLLNDGTSTYGYDAANRLTSVTSGSTTSSYTYNGLGDRLSQTVNSVTTNYALDLNAGLTQVLAQTTQPSNDPTTYLYGNGRIGELQPGGFAYHLGDALGSVRQLTDGGGEVRMARSFEPYGSTLSSAGSGNSVFQYTGEARDASTGLTFLRARYLNNQIGRLISRDTWRGDARRPMSFNAWLYAYANPINGTDPSGLITCEDSTDASCIAMAQDLKSFAESLKQSVEDGTLLPVEAYAQLADRAVANFGDINGVMWGMTNVLVGVDPNAIGVWKVGVSSHYSKQIKSAASPYYIGQDWLPYKHDPSKDDPSRKYRHSEIGDWKPEYWDDTPNQAYHSWYFVAVQYYDNAIYANAANVVHDPYFLEPTCGDDLKGLISAINGAPFVGPSIASYLTFFGETSEQDFKLSQKAMELGNGMWWAFDIGPVKVPWAIDEPGNWIRTNWQNPLASTSPSFSQSPSRLVRAR